MVLVSAGKFHTVVCTADGEVSTFGCGDYGKLGHGSEGSVYELNTSNREPEFVIVCSFSS